MSQTTLRKTPAPGRYLLGRVLGGRYRVDGYIGGGGMGTVYRGRQLSVDRAVALKVLRAELVADGESARRFEHEARVVARLRHPNIVQLIDFGSDELERGGARVYYMVLELVEGASLGSHLRSGSPPPLAWTLQVARQILVATGYAHAKGIVHRDLKPQNVLLEESAGLGLQARVLDFGLAKVVEATGPALTQTGATFGTPEYMAPEQWQARTVDGRTDLYSLACILFQMLTGELPYKAATPLALAMQHTNAPVPALVPPEGAPPFPAALVELVTRCLAKAPADRCADAAAAMDLLESAVAAVERSGTPVGPPVIAWDSGPAVPLRAATPPARPRPGSLPEAAAVDDSLPVLGAAAAPAPDEAPAGERAPAEPPSEPVVAFSDSARVWAEPEELEKPSRGRRLALAGALVVALALGLGLAWSLMRGPSVPAPAPGAGTNRGAPAAASPPRATPQTPQQAQPTRPASGSTPDAGEVRDASLRADGAVPAAAEDLGPSPDGPAPGSGSGSGLRPPPRRSDPVRRPPAPRPDPETTFREL